MPSPGEPWLSPLRGVGLFGIEVVLADLDGDHALDVVQSSGANVSPQPLAVYHNTGDQLPYLGMPSWFSETVEFRGALAVGDVNGDGWLDVVVPVLYGRDHRGLGRIPDGGRVEVYLSACGVLPARPSYVFAVPDTPLSVALGDVDADGDLDLAVGSVGRDEAGADVPATQYVYFNRQHRLSAEAPARGPRLAVATVLFADLDQDGWLDLVSGGDRVSIFKGGPTAFSSTLPPPRQLAPTFSAAFGMTAGRLGAGAGPLSLLVADHCPGGAGCAPQWLWRFDPGPDGLPAPAGARLLELQNGSHLRLIDGNQDGAPDLLVTQLGPEESGASMLFLQGVAGGGWAAPVPTAAFPGGQIAVGDVLSKRSQERRFELATPARPASILTLPVTSVEEVRAVLVDEVPLARGRFTWVPGANWLALAQPDGRPHTVTVVGTWSPVQSLVVASHDPPSAPM